MVKDLPSSTAFHYCKKKRVTPVFFIGAILLKPLYGKGIFTLIFSLFHYKKVESRNEIVEWITEQMHNFSNFTLRVVWCNDIIYCFIVLSLGPVLLLRTRCKAFKTKILHCNRHIFVTCAVSCTMCFGQNVTLR